jgi:GT2 family glycosyltransferase
VSRAAGGLDVRLVEGPDAGRPDGRNRGARAARGRLPAFVDDDCLPAAGFAAEMAAMLERRPDALVGGRIANGLPGNRWAEAAQLVIEVGDAPRGGGGGDE